MIRGRTGSKRISISNDSPPLSEQELLTLANPFTALASKDRRLRHYSAAFLAALGGNSTRVEAGSTNKNGQSLTLTIENGTPLVSHTKRPNMPNNWIARSSSTNSWFDQFREYLKSNLTKREATPSFWSHLKRRTRHCPVPLIWNGTPLNSPIHCNGAVYTNKQLILSCGGEMDGGAYLLGNKPGAGAISGFSETHGRPLVWAQEAGPGEWETLHRSSRSFLEINRIKILRLPPELHLEGFHSVSHS